MNLKKFDFMQSNIVDCAFANCNLCESNFSDCDLKNTQFYNCNLKKADFRNATGYDINLAENRVKGAVFSSREAVRLLSPFEIKIVD